MSTQRYSGELRIRVTYLEPGLGKGLGPHGGYRCFVKAPGISTTVTVSAPKFLTHAVDSPEAFDDAARAAIAFAEDNPGGFAELAATNPDGSGFYIARREADAWGPCTPECRGAPLGKTEPAPPPVMTEPDAHCVTSPDGDCISTDPRDMHAVPSPKRTSLLRARPMGGFTAFGRGLGVKIEVENVEKEEEKEAATG